MSSGSLCCCTAGSNWIGTFNLSWDFSSLHCGYFLFQAHISFSLKIYGLFLNCSPSKLDNTDKRNLKITTLAEVVGGWSHLCWHGILRFTEWETWLKCTLLSQGQKGEIRWNNDKKKPNKWVPCLPEGRLCWFYECENLFLALHRHLWKMCHCCIFVCVSCQKEWAWGNLAHLTDSAGTLVEPTTSFWRALWTPQLTKGPARSETTLDVVLENHPGALNKTEASKHLGRSDLNAFRLEMSPAEGSSSKAWNIRP